MKRKVKKMLLIFSIILVMLSLGIGIYLQQAKFGTLPEGPRLQRIKNSPHYIDGQFQNLVPTPPIVDGKSLVSVWL